MTAGTVIQKNFYFLARRFIAGETIASAIEAVRSLNDLGMSATLDFLGEDVLQREAAIASRDVYFEMLDAIASSGVDSNVSVKLTAMGLCLDEDFAAENLAAIVERAARNPDPFVRIDMEGSAVVDATLRVFDRVYAEHRNVGVVLQAYLKRTAAGRAASDRARARVRLCKGAYSEPPEIAIKPMPEIRDALSRTCRVALDAGALSRHRNPRSPAYRRRQKLRSRTWDRARPLRVPNAARLPPERTAGARA